MDGIAGGGYSEAILKETISMSPSLLGEFTGIQEPLLESSNTSIDSECA